MLFTFFTGTRGALLGLLGGTFVAIVIFSIYTDKSIYIGLLSKIINLQKFLAIMLIMTSLSLGTLYFISQSSSNSQWIKKTPLSILNRINLKEGTLRISFWKSAINGAKERPLIGWGPGNFETVVYKYYEPTLINSEPRMDRVHNVFLDTLVDQGIIGLIIYVSFYTICLYLIIRALHRKNITLLEGSVLTGFFTASIIQNLFLFDTINTFLTFVIVSIYTPQLLKKDMKKAEAGKPKFNSPFGYFVILILIFITSYSIWIFNINEVVTTLRYMNAFNSPGPSVEQAQKIGNAIAKLRKGDLSINNSYQGLTINGVKSDKTEVAQSYIELAKKVYNSQQSKLNLVSPEIIMYTIYDTMRIHNNNYDEKEIEVLKTAISYSPKRQAAYYFLITLYLQRKDLKDAETVFTKLNQIDYPNNPLLVSSEIDLLISKRDSTNLLYSIQKLENISHANGTTNAGDVTTELLKIVRRTKDKEDLAYFRDFYYSKLEFDILNKVAKSSYPDNFYNLMLIEINFNNKEKALQYLEIAHQIDKTIEYDKLKPFIDSL